MGNFLGSVFGKSGPEIDLDLAGDDNTLRKEAQQKAYDECEALLARCGPLLTLVDDYQGCQKLAFVAIKEGGHENELAAFEGLLGAVASIDEFHKFAQDLDKVFPNFIQCIAADYDPSASLQDNVPQALCRQLCRLVSFAIQFDKVRMERPHLSNDFSYYRRLLPKFNKHPNVKIGEDAASAMAMFTAEHIPMVRALINASFRATNTAGKNVELVLALLGNSCLKAIREAKYASRQDLHMLCARAMTGAIVMFDHVADPHAFHKKSPLKTKEIITSLKRDFGKEVGLQKYIEFCTKHFSEAPASIQNLLLK
jgi:hypothetical protein